jgi:phosphoglycerate dehydrogenase-like enzyme
VWKVLLAEGLDAAAERRLCAAAEVARARAGDEDSLRAAIRDCDALVVRTHTRVSRKLLDAAPRLRVIGVAGVGVENVDMTEAGRRGIAVVNTPAAASDAVAEFTVALVLQLLRPVPRLAEAYGRGEFHRARAAAHGRELRDLTIGIVGMGRIGSRVGRICSAGFGCRVLYNDIVPVGPFDFATESVDKPTIWSEADVISLHVPLTKLTRGLVKHAVLGQMKPGALLVNTSRGGVVDTAALTDALRAGRLGGAALDVSDPEPLPGDHPLLAMPNCIITPHVAARTFAGLSRMFGVVDEVIRVLGDPS